MRKSSKKRHLLTKVNADKVEISADLVKYKYNTKTITKKHIQSQICSIKGLIRF